MGGREGLIDTAVKTSTTGYLQVCVVVGGEGLAAGSTTVGGLAPGGGGWPSASVGTGGGGWIRLTAAVGRGGSHRPRPNSSLPHLQVVEVIPLRVHVELDREVTRSAPKGACVGDEDEDLG